MRVPAPAIVKGRHFIFQSLRHYPQSRHQMLSVHSYIPTFFTGPQLSGPPSSPVVFQYLSLLDVQTISDREEILEDPV